MFLALMHLTSVVGVCSNQFSGCGFGGGWLLIHDFLLWFGPGIYSQPRIPGLDLADGAPGRCFKRRVSGQKWVMGTCVP